MNNEIKKVLLIILLTVFSDSVFSKPEKPRIAILTPTISSEVPKYLLDNLNNIAFQNEIELAIQATNKFEITTRQKSAIQAILNEQEFSNSDLSRGQAAQSGQMDAANLLVQVEVQSFRFYRQNKPVPNISNKYTQKDSGSLFVNIKILDSTSGSVKKSFILEDSFSGKRKIVNNKGGLPHPIHLQRMYKNIAQQMSNKLIESVFPMLVIQIKGVNIYLNRGSESGMNKGERLAVFHAGEVLIDPYTGESLGSSEEELGILKVVDIKPKYSIATPIDKTIIDKISLKDIVRKK